MNADRSPMVADVSLLEVADAPTNMYNYMLRFKSKNVLWLLCEKGS